MTAVVGIITISYEASLVRQRSPSTRFVSIITMLSYNKASAGINNRWPTKSFSTNSTSIRMERTRHTTRYCAGFRPSIVCRNVIARWSWRPHSTPYWLAAGSLCQDCIEFREIQMKLLIDGHIDSLFHQRHYGVIRQLPRTAWRIHRRAKRNHTSHPLDFRPKESYWSPCENLSFIPPGTITDGIKT